MNKNVNLSWNRTKKQVESAMNLYDYYNLSICNNTRIKEDYSLEIIQEVDCDKRYLNIKEEDLFKRIDYFYYIRYSFNKLTTCERKIIYWTYLDKENAYDDRYIANNLGFSLGYYYSKKKETLIRFAYALGLEEYND